MDVENSGGKGWLKQTTLCTQQKLCHWSVPQTDHGKRYSGRSCILRMQAVWVSWASLAGDALVFYDHLDCLTLARKGVYGPVAHEINGDSCDTYGYVQAMT